MFHSKKDRAISNTNKNEDDDDLFAVSSQTREKLAAIFSDDSTSKTFKDLKYTAPKQPVKDPSKSTIENVGNSQKMSKSEIGTSSEILFVSSGNLFLQENSALNYKGLAMCAVMKRSHDTFFILIYKTKQHIIAQVRIHLHSNFKVEKNNYLVYSEDAGVLWSLNLEESKFQELITQIGICRAVSSFSDSNAPLYVKQILTEGMVNNVLGPEDTAFISFSSWDVENCRKGKEVKEKKSKVKLKLHPNSNNWESELIGSQEREHCLIFVRNTTSSPITVFDVTVEPLTDIKSPQESVMNESDNINDILPEMNQYTTRADNDGNKKASLISRMAKVGQPLLPTTPKRSLVIPAAPTDSESEVDDHAHGKPLRYAHRNPPSHLRSSASSSMEEINVSSARSRVPSDNVSGQFQTYVGGPPAYGHPQGLGVGTMVPYQSFQPNLSHLEQSKSKSNEPMLSLLFSETRSQHTELRVAISQLTQKVDAVIDKVNNLDTHSSGVQSRMPLQPTGLMPSTSYYEPRELVERITSMFEQLELYKEKEKNYHRKIEVLTQDYTQLMKKNQGLLEEKAELVSLKGESQESRTQGKLHIQELLSIQEEKIKVQSEKELLLLENKRLKSEVEEQSQTINDLERKAGTYELKYEQATKTLQQTQEENEEMKRITLELDKVKEENEKVKETLREITKEKMTVEQTIRDIRKENSELHSKDSSLTLQLENKLNSLEQQLKEQVQKSDLDQQCIQQMKYKLEESRRSYQELEDLSRNKNDYLTNKVEELKSRQSLPVDNGRETEASIKRIMNVAYKKLKASLVDSEVYDKSSILEMVLTSIRDTTLNYLENLNESKEKLEVENKKESVSDVQKSRDVTAIRCKDELMDSTEIKESQESDGASERCNLVGESTSGQEDSSHCKENSPSKEHIEAKYLENDDNISSKEKLERSENKEELKLNEKAEENLEKSENNVSEKLTESNCLEPSNSSPVMPVPSITDSNLNTSKNVQNSSSKLHPVLVDDNPKSESSSDFEVHGNSIEKEVKSLSDQDSKPTVESQASVFDPTFSSNVGGSISSQKSVVEPAKKVDQDLTNASSNLSVNEKSLKEEEHWKPVPPPPPLFSDSEDDDDWLLK